MLTFFSWVFKIKRPERKSENLDFKTFGKPDFDKN